MAAGRSFAVGAFVLGGLALGAAAILVFGGLHLFATTIRVVSYFPGSVAGLAVGAPVTFRGVKVGTVSSMQVHVELADLKAVIPVYLDLDPSQLSWTQGSPGPGELKRAVRAGLRAQLVAQSLVTGQLAVDLDFRPGAIRATAGSPDDTLEIPAVTSDIQHLKDQLVELDLPALADKASRAMGSLQRVLDDLEGKAGQEGKAGPDGKAGALSQAVLQTIADARTTLQTATRTLLAVRAETAGTLANIDRFATAGRQQLASSGRTLDAALARAVLVLGQANTLTASLNEATGARSPMRSDLQAILRDLAASASSLRTLTRDLQRNPAGTLLGKASR